MSKKKNKFMIPPQAPVRQRILISDVIMFLLVMGVVIFGSYCIITGMAFTERNTECAVVEP